MVAETTYERVEKAVRWAATVEPPLLQRKTRYRRAPGIGSYDVESLDVRTALDSHSASEAPAGALRIVLSPDHYVDVLLFDGSEVRAWFRSLNPGDRSYNEVVAAFPWAEALAARTAEYLTDAGVTNSVETVSLRSW